MTTATPSPPTRRDLAQVVDIVRSFVRARVQLRGTRQGARVRCHGRVLVPGRAGVEIGQRAVFLGGTIPTELRCQEGAELVIGPRSVLNYGVSIVAHRSVRIGTGCMIGSLVHIRDDDGRRTEPVIIGEGVWIAHGAVIEPGTTIGAGAVIGAMTVVSGTVPARSLATGNPAHHLPLEPASRRLGAPGSSRGRDATTNVAGRRDSGTGGARGREASARASRNVLADGEQAAPSRHSRSEVRAAIVDWLDDTRHFGAAESLIRSDSMSLRAGGLLDSLGVVELVVMLEKRFGVRINRERVAHAGSQSMSSFVELVTGPRENSP